MVAPPALLASPQSTAACPPACCAHLATPKMNMKLRQRAQQALCLYV